MRISDWSSDVCSSDLIEFNGRSLLGWQVAALVANGIQDIVVVTGFRTERVEDHALELYRDTGARVRTLFNPFFQVADNLGTCWIARGEMDRDFIILNGDTIVSDEVVDRLIRSEEHTSELPSLMRISYAAF